jgi:serpin B
VFPLKRTTLGINCFKRWRRGVLLSVLVAVVMIIAMNPPLAAEQDTDLDAARRTAESLDAAQRAAESINAFAFDMYKELAKRDKKNILFSPYSISSAVAMLYAGSSNEAKNELQNVMRYTPDVHTAMRELRGLIKKNDGEETIFIANAVWPDYSFELLPSYVATVGKYYGAELTQLDFITKWSQAEDEINNWTEKNTKNMIKKILPKDSLKPQDKDFSRIVLTNTMYADVKWLKPFNEDVTSDDFFYGMDAKKTVRFMYQETRSSYFETEDFQMVSLGYKSPSGTTSIIIDRAINLINVMPVFSMVIILPKEEIDIDSIENGFSGGRFQKYLEGMNLRRTLLHLPKFKFEWEDSLSSDFEKLGLRSIFSYNSENFLNLSATESPIKVSKILHKTAIEVDEKSTEAAAATAILLLAPTSTADPIQEEDEAVRINVNRPFIFFIIEERTKTILFMGRCVQP